MFATQESDMTSATSLSPWSKNPRALLLLMSFAMPIAFSTWMALLNNFAIEVAQFTGREIGILQSLREIPGFLAFTAVFVLLILKEQVFAYLSLLVLGLGVALTGFFPTVYGLYFTTVIMSIGFHYFETMNQSLTLQWIDKAETPGFLGKMMSFKSAAAIISFGGIWLMVEHLQVPYVWIYALFGGSVAGIVIYAWLTFPQFEQPVVQHKKLLMRRRYWLFYALTFLSGARRQIFVVFAGFLLVEKFGYSAGEIALLYLVNHFINLLFAAKIGRWIGRIGERRALAVEYVGLIVIFLSYSVVTSHYVASVLYIADHLFFAMAIAIKTYFQKIADPKDMASTAGVSFTINHIAAVVLPAALGLVWLIQPGAVFVVGAGIAVLSLILSRLIPQHPAEGNETRQIGTQA